MHADAVQIGSVISNLLADAVKFRRDEPPQVRICAERERAPGASSWRTTDPA